MSDRQFPIGRFAPPATITAADRAGWIERLRTAPERMKAAAEGLSEAQLRTPYREGGWSARQVIHHVPDSHMNGYIRFKMALTEENPVIKPYDEKAWALLSDAVRTPIETSLALLAALHERWLVVIAGMREEDWKRQFLHPELGPMTLERQIGLYAWHGDHHIAHVKSVMG
jgi:hypothetical protein